MEALKCCAAYRFGAGQTGGWGNGSISKVPHTHNGYDDFGLLVGLDACFSFFLIQLFTYQRTFLFIADGQHD
jgi:hypothetical protein